MEKIKITIPDNLNPEQELLAIAKQLGKNLLPSGKNKLLGTGYEIKHLQMQIEITRESVEKTVVTRECPICKSLFQQTAGKILWTNYGGNKKRLYYCSDNCRQQVIEVAGQGRVSINKSKLVPLRTW